ncbi:rhodopsin, GQ-coupled-like [Acanthaster planci]|uniref:Rhodopsin, GQ-coupled-like n=1 Tax=Acanthaster planci TaxID=133434 RepID=A0A8B7YVX4_ACAPL|nr:rhodopsin, GQ-coupled-like [Acanthaster planci]
MDFSAVLNETYGVTSANSSDGVKSIYSAYLERQILSGFGFVVGAVGFFGNLAVITAILSFKRLQTRTNVFVLNLAVADVLTCTVSPLQALTVLHDELVIPPWSCKLVAFCLVTCIGCSINTLACIAVNRLVRITTMAMYHKLYTPFKLFLMISVSWCVPIAVATIPLFTDHAEYGFNNVYKSCTWESKTSYDLTYAKLIAIMFFPLQFTILFASYLKIYVYVRKKTQSMLRLSSSGDTIGSGSQAIQRQLWRRQVAVTKNLFLVVCVFLLCMIPYFATIGLPIPVIRSLLSYAAAILMTNSSLNPIIYGTKHPDFRMAFAYILCYRRKRHHLGPKVTALSGQNRSDTRTIAANMPQQMV